VACAKLNISENRQGFTFKITDGIINILDEYVDVTADEMLQERMAGNQEKRRTPGPKPEVRDNCCDWLMGFMASGIAVEANEAYEKAVEAGYSKRTTDRAKKILGIESNFQHSSGHWFWSFPENIQANSGTKNNLATSGDCQIVFEGFDNLAISGQSLENKGFESEKLQENFRDCQIPPIYINNLATSEKNQSILPVSTVETNCGKDEKSGKKPDEVIITKTKTEMQERVKQIAESKQERLERIKQQAEENFKKAESFKNTIPVHKESQDQAIDKIKSLS
jgi:hypothetical protein